MAIETDTPFPDLSVSNVYFEGEESPHGRALDLYAQAEGFHSFAELAAQKFDTGLFIRCTVEKRLVYVDPEEGGVYLTRQDCINSMGRDPVERIGYCVDLEAQPQA